MRSTSSLHKLMRPTAALALTASVLGIASAPASAEGPCGTPLFSGDTTRIGNLIFLDADNDGNFEPGAGEVGLSGVGVELWLDADGDGAFEPTGDDAGGPVCATSTDAGGNYWFTDVASGQYFVAVASAPAGHASSTGSVNDLTSDNSDQGDETGSYASVTGALTIDSGTNQPTDEAAPGAAAGADEASANAAVGNTADSNSNLTFDLGFAPTSTGPTCLSIGNRVWFDTDGDGDDDAEDGIDGVTLQLFAADADGNATGSAVGTTTTTADGYYLFTCVDPGTYVVVIPSANFGEGEALDGMASTADLDGANASDLMDDGIDPVVAGGDIVSQPMTLTIGGAPVNELDKPAGAGLDFDAPADDSSDTTVDFGFVEETIEPPTVEPASIGDKVWIDANNNGIQDAGEAPVAGVKVELRDGDGVVLDTMTTDANGMYRFIDLAPGDYQVCFDMTTLPSGMIATVANQGGDALDSDAAADGCTPVVTLEPGEDNPTIDLGIVEKPVVVVEKASLGDKVWIDANNNGIQDAGESPVANVTVQLKADDGTIIDTTVTDANGMYGFDELEPGDYQVCFDLRTLPDGMIVTDNNNGDDDSIDSDADAVGCTPVVTLAAGEHNPTIDLGIRMANSDLGVVKTGEVLNGAPVWTIAVTNLGTDQNPGKIVVTDTLPTTLDFVSASGGGFDCTAAGRTLTCTRAAALEVGATATLTVNTKTNSTSTCSVTNAVVVSSPASDTVVANNSTNATLTVSCTKAAVQTNTPVQNRNLPVTGSSTGMLVGLALLLAAGGWKISAHANRERPISIKDMLG